jgi:hypothetical protein
VFKGLVFIIQQNFFLMLPSAIPGSKYIISFFFLLLELSLYSQQGTLKIHVRGIYQTKISLLPLAGTAPSKSISEIITNGNNENAFLTVPMEWLPGEFILRFDYKEKENSAPYPSEKRMFISNQNIELWVNPMFSNSSDSTWFGKDEKENSTYVLFSKQNTERRQKLSLLQSFLVNYDDFNSNFYQQGIMEYEKRRNNYNQWLNQQIQKDKPTFVSHTYQFQYVQKVSWSGTEAMRNQSIKEHYFDLVDFSDPVLTKTADLKEWMNAYVNLFGAIATTVPIRDSLFALAGKRAIEKSKKGSPEVYGWMVDYFYNGFESFGINKGIEMLQPYLDDPRCLTAKKTAITKRLEGIKTLIPGSVAPDFLLSDSMGNFTTFSSFHNKAYKLVLFWSASCSHCTDLVKKLYPLFLEEGKEQMDVFAVSVDESPGEIQSWNNAIAALHGWKHSRPDGGINSKEAKAYFILSTPFMILVDGGTNKIVALPEKAETLFDFLHG